MKIKKVAPSSGVLATISNLPADSQKDTYSCDYLNKRTVIVSSEEPKGGEEVWLQKGKNLFDRHNRILRGYTLNDTGGVSGEANSFAQNAYIEVEPNNGYTLSTSLDITTVSNGRLVINEYTADYTFICRNIERTTNFLTITTNENTKYVKVTGPIASLSTLILAEGGLPIPYEEYSRKVYTNSDSGYQLFQDLGPKRKVVYYNSNPTAKFPFTAVIYLSPDYFDYDELEFWCYTGADNGSMVMQKTKPGLGTVVTSFSGYAGNIYSRGFLHRDDGHYTVHDCYYYGASDTTPPSADNNALIPAYIIGIKY